MIVVDACAWVLALVGSGPRADLVRGTLTDEPRWVAPAQMPLEVIRTLRRGAVSGQLTSGQASRWAHLVATTELELVGPGAKVLSRVWTLRDSVSIYDAPYVAIAEAFDIPLVTVDVRLARAARVQGVHAIVPGDPR